jgi:hypothetical protein
VVDEHGQFVPHALIVVDAGLPSIWEDFTYFVEANESGNFLFYEPEKTSFRKRARTLYVTGPFPKNAFGIITPPFSRLPRLTGSSFSGRRIFINKNGEINIGDTQVQVRYGVVHICLEDYDNKPLITNQRAWRYVWLRVRDQKGEMVTLRSLSLSDIEKSVSVHDSCVNVALPEGIWYVEASPNEDKSSWLSSNTPVHVDASLKDSTLRLKLPLRRQNRSVYGLRRESIKMRY